jgi:hypothetical protein
VFGVTIVLILQNSCGIVLVFWFWQEIVFDVTYVLKYNTVVQLCQFFVVAGNKSQNENTF